MLDFFDLNPLLSEEQRAVRDTVRSFVDAEVLPVIRGAWHEGVFPRQLVPRFAELGLLGAPLPSQFGGSDLDAVSYRLIQYELERGDSGLRSFASVTSGLVMYPIFSYGSDEQRKKYLSELAAGRMIGCFGLTESESGSDPGAMHTTARKDGG